MKKLVLILLCLPFILCACTNHSDEYFNSTLSYDSVDIFNKTTMRDEKIMDNSLENEEFVGAWISYLELKPEKENMSEGDYKSQMEKIFDGLARVKVNNVFVHVRANCDAIYPSKYFPVSKYCDIGDDGNIAFDYFSVILAVANEHNMKVHAWINPYRICSGEGNLSVLGENPVAKAMYDNSDGEDVILSDNGIYFNPASLNVQKLIIDSVREILENYDVAGIHIDDYFYPTTNESFDKESYSEYKKSSGKLELSSWRRENVNSLLRGIFSAVKAFGQDKLFSVSPCGDIERNFNELYADVNLWCSEDGYTDMIIPQIYYGFDNEKQPFERCLDGWKNIVKDEKVAIVIGLPLYKVGCEDVFAGEKGKNEWQRNSDIIKRQVEYLRNKDCDGFALYSAGYVNNSGTFMENEIQGLQSVL